MKKIFINPLSFVALVLVVACFCCSQPSHGEEEGFILPEYSKKVSLDFRNTNIKDVLKAFARQIGVSFITSREVEDKQITVFLENVPVEEALQKILSLNGLAYEYDQLANMIVVKPAPKSQDEQVMTRVYQLHYASVDSAKIRSTISISSSDSTGSSGGDSSGGSSSNSSSSSSGSLGGIANALKSVLSKEGKIVEDPRTNSLVITDVQVNFPAVERMLARLDVPVPQVLIQVEMLDVSKLAADQMGVKFNPSLSITGAKMDTYLPFNGENIRDKSATSAAGVAGGAASSAKYQYSAISNTVGTIDASQMSLMLQFLKSQTDTRSLARPRLITVDNETAQIKISTDEAIGTQQTSSSTGGSSSTSTVEAERTKTGVFLTVTPQVNLLTDEITLAVVPRVVDAQDSPLIDGHQFKNPEERGVKSILRVRSGNTIFIGGLLRRTDKNISTKVPFFSEIPILGLAFRHKDNTGTERELVIFITPYILGSTNEVPETIMQEELKFREDHEQDIPDRRKSLIDKDMDKAGIKGSL